MPSSRMSSKRKASSLARPSKNVASSARTAGLDRGSPDNPIIRAQDVFGSGPLTRSSNVGDTLEAGLSALLDEDDTELFDMDISDTAAGSAIPINNAGPAPRTRFTDAMMVVRAQLTETSTSAAEPLQCYSAILFSTEASGLTGGMSDGVTKLRYLPLCPRSSINRPEAITKDTELIVLPSHGERINNLTRTISRCQADWPGEVLPVEIFNLITASLSRDDLKSMRLVNREFEEKVSANLFASAVVPFNTELYDMIEEDSKAAHRMPRATPAAEAKGKAKAIDSSEQPSDRSLRGLHWQNAKDDTEGKVYKGHGLRVFQGFGPYFRRFGMSFEVAEDQLARPPMKKELDHVTAYYGSYEWPHQQYTRFAGLAGLERTADETLRMKAAFSNLGRVQDLGLSIDSGLGWLNGPDRSIHARVFQRPSPVFGPSRLTPDQQAQDAQTFWQALQDCHASIGFRGNQKEVSLDRRILSVAPSEIAGIQDSKFANTQAWSSIAAGKAVPAISSETATSESRYGLLYTSISQTDLTTSAAYDKSALVPAELRKEQKEWLMETDWAQRAFLECYMLAVMDNPANFGQVKVLTIAKVSSGLLPILSREAFWEALPSVTDVTIHVKPDWRTVERDNAGYAEVCQRHPSEAVTTFYRCILRDRLCLKSTIKKLNIGWTAGGEHAEGVFARNNHVLPAPITQLDHCTAVNNQLGLIFSFVEHLTLHNCWITPVALEGLIKSHADKALKTLTLDSVSLTAHPRFAAGGQAAMQNHVLQALAALPAAAGQAQQAIMPQWLQNIPGLPAGWQQLLQNNVQQAAQLAWAANPAAQPVPQLFNQQQAQQNNAHAQVIQQVNAAVAAFNAAAVQPVPPPALGPLNVPPPLPANVPAAQNGQNFAAQQNQADPSHWTQGHREGSWAEMLDKLSPGAIFSDFLPQPQPWDEPLPARAPTNLQAIELRSCGYVKLVNNTTIDQLAIEAGSEHHLSPWFRGRQAALLPAMMTTNDRYIGRIVQHMSEHELNALQYAWGLGQGWADRAKAEEVEYDGLLPGGTGRFSGKIEKGSNATT